MRGSLGTMSRPIIDSHFNKVYWSGNPNLNPEALDLFATAERFPDSREGTVYYGAYSNNILVKLAFADSSFYVPKR